MVVEIYALVPFDIRASSWLYLPVVVSIRSYVLHLWKYLLANRNRIFPFEDITNSQRGFEAHGYHPILTKITVTDDDEILCICADEMTLMLCHLLFFGNKNRRTLEVQTVIFIFQALIYLLLTHVWQFQLIESFS